MDYDTFSCQLAPSERTLCGHIDLSPRGSAMGRADGIDFKAAEHVKQHPPLAEQGALRDLDSHPWATFRNAQ